MSKHTHWLPTRPYSLIDAVNRMAAATGSCRYAQLSHYADYNGHRVSVYFNDYRGYWLAEYTWSGRNVIGRGSFADCLRAAKAEYDRGALGAEVVVETHTPEDVATAEAAGCVPYSEEARAAHRATYADARYAEVNGAMRYEEQMGVPAVAFLIQSATVKEYEERLDAYFKAQRAARIAARGTGEGSRP